jgi:DnaK suppressor protein
MTDTNHRIADLRRVLLEHRRAMLAGVHGRIRDGCAERPTEVRDAVDDSDAHVQTDIELGVLQMRSETLRRIDEALAQLAAGTYGVCADCEGEISAQRLRALPFGVRCQACEGRREQLRLRGSQRTDQDAGLWSARWAAS